MIDPVTEKRKGLLLNKPKLKTDFVYTNNGKENSGEIRRKMEGKRREMEGKRDGREERWKKREMNGRKDR